MEIGNFKMHRRAVGTFGQLDADEQAQVRTRLAFFSEIPLAQWPPALVKRLPGPEPIYLMRINESLRAFVQADERLRLEWRREHVIVNSKQIRCVTYDQLLADMFFRLGPSAVAENVG